MFKNWIVGTKTDFVIFLFGLATTLSFVVKKKKRKLRLAEKGNWELSTRYPYMYVYIFGVTLSERTNIIC